MWLLSVMSVTGEGSGVAIETGAFFLFSLLIFSSESFYFFKKIVKIIRLNNRYLNTIISRDLLGNFYIKDQFGIKRYF